MTKLLPTPAAGNFNDGEDLASWEARRQRNLAKGVNGNGQGTPLPVAVAKLFRTPTSQLAVNGGSQHPDKRKAGGHGPTLADEVEHLLPTPTARTQDRSREEAERRHLPGRAMGRGGGASPDLASVAALLLPTPTAELNAPAPWKPGVDWWLQSRATRNLEGVVTGNTPLLGASYEQQVVDWGPYARAVLRWAQVLGVLPPHPVEPGKTGMRLSPAFVEWMQGLPAGWVTAVPGLSRNAQLKALGNGVVPQQAVLALAILLSRVPRA